MNVEQTLFHPVISSADLPVAEPIAATLLGQALVLWRDELGAARAFADQCPHRGAALSLGKVVHLQGKARLQCAYHGWQFDGAAQCQHVPAQPRWQPPPGLCARAYACVESQGMVWVCLQPNALAAVPRFALDADATWVHAISGPYAVSTSAPRLVENFLDMTHFGFVHEGFLGDALHTELDAYAVQENIGPEMPAVVVPDCAVWQPNAFEAESGAAGHLVRYRYEVLAPYTVTLIKLGEQGRLFIAMLNCPLNDSAAGDAQHTKTWFWIAASGLGQTPQQLSAFQDLIFAQDLAVVESQTPKSLPLGGTELHGPLDRVSAAYRRYLKRIGASVGVIG